MSRRNVKTAGVRGTRRRGGVLPARSAGLVAALAVIMAACTGAKTPEIRAGLDACSYCNMVITQLNQACGYFAGNTFAPFDSPLCLLRAYEQRVKSGATVPQRIYFSDFAGGGFVPADSAVFLLTRRVPTVMESGVLCFASKDSAASYKIRAREVLTDWRGFRVLKGTPDRRVELRVGPETVQPEVVVLNKGELVAWRLLGDGLAADVRLGLKGYDELGQIVVPATGQPVTVRMLADKPGAGFPWVRVEGGQILGMVKVAGAHTSEEEAM